MGRLILVSPWSRDAFRPEHRPDVEDLIPHGTTLTIGAYTKPGEWTLRLTADGTRELRHEARVYAHDLAFACIETLRRWARQDEHYTVTVDLEGTPTLHGWEKN